MRAWPRQRPRRLVWLSWDSRQCPAPRKMPPQPSPKRRGLLRYKPTYAVLRDEKSPPRRGPRLLRNLAAASNHSRRHCDGNGFNFQCAHWRLKRYLQSVRRPEILENFRHTQFHFLRAPKPSGFFNATKPSVRRAWHAGSRLYLRRRKLGTSGVKPRRGCPRSSLGLS